MWLKFSENSNPLYFGNRLHSLNDLNVDEDSFLKILSANNVKNETLLSDFYPLKEEKIARKINALSMKNRKGVIFLKGEWKATLLTKLFRMESGCPIFICASNTWDDQAKETKISPRQIKQKGKSVFKSFFSKQTFKKGSNILLSIFSGITLIFTFAYGAFTSQFREDSMYQYISKAIIDSGYPCGHATYESDEATFTSIGQMNSNAVQAGNSLYTNFDIGKSTDVKKRTYVATYMQINTPESTTFSFEGLDFSPVALTLSDFGYAFDKDDSENVAYGRFFNVSLYRYKYIARDWEVAHDYDAPIYISKFSADRIIDQSDTIHSYDDLLGKEIEVNIDGILLNCVIANILTDGGHASYLSSFYQDFCILQVASYSNRNALKYSFCFDPSTSYLNIKTVASPSYIANWVKGSTLKFYVWDKNSGDYAFLSEYSETLTAHYNGETNTALSTLFLVALIVFLIATFSFVGIIIYRKVKKRLSEATKKFAFSDAFEIFIFLVIPIFLTQLALHIIQLVFKSNIQSFFAFNYFGSNFSAIYFFVLLALLIFSYVALTNNDSPKKPQSKLRNELYEINI